MLYALAYLGFTTVRAAEQMTLSEYHLLMEAYSLRKVEDTERLATQAWFNQQVQATVGSGKSIRPKYKKLDDFYDPQAEIAKIRSKYEPNYSSGSHPVERQNAASVFAKRMAEYEKRFGRRKDMRKEDKHG